MGPNQNKNDFSDTGGTPVNSYGGGAVSAGTDTGGAVAPANSYEQEFVNSLNEDIVIKPDKKQRGPMDKKVIVLIVLVVLTIIVVVAGLLLPKIVGGGRQSAAAVRPAYEDFREKTTYVFDAALKSMDMVIDENDEEERKDLGTLYGELQESYLKLKESAKSIKNLSGDLGALDEIMSVAKHSMDEQAIEMEMVEILVDDGKEALVQYLKNLLPADSEDVDLKDIQLEQQRYYAQVAVLYDTYNELGCIGGIALDYDCAIQTPESRFNVNRQDSELTSQRRKIQGPLVFLKLKDKVNAVLTNMKENL